MTSDPIRLLDDPSVAPSVRGDLSHAAKAEVVGLDLAGGLRALQQATSAGTPAAGTSLAAKLGLGAALCGGAVALWLAWGREPPPAPVAPSAGPFAAIERPDVGGEPAKHPAVAVPEQPTSVRDDGEDAPASTPGSAEPGALEAPAIDPAATEEGEPAIADDPSEPAADIEDDDAPLRSDASHGARAHRNGTHERTDEPEVDDVLREARLVAKARSKLGRDPAAALALAEEAARDFPQGQLIEERRAIAIRALLALGRLDEAQRRAEPFLATYGRGAHAAAVRRALTEARPASDADSPRP